MPRLTRILTALASCFCGCASATAGGMPPDFVELADVAPAIRQDIRYATDNNFTGRVVPGYGAAHCWLRREVAMALAQVQVRAQADGLSLIVYDCYRPQRASDAFVAWAADGADQLRKAEYYPHIEKSTLFAQGYIGRRSAHSLGTTVDIGLMGADGMPMDFGTAFDFFSPASATHARQTSPAAARNRADLLARMQAAGFENYKNEWWHFTLKGVSNAQAYDIPIR